ncbi:hypothetical protein Aduo_001655 [Ancylostoma duodenale]
MILAHLCAGEVKETEIVIKSDSKMRLSVLVALNGVILHLTAFATSKDGDYYRGRLLSNQWREDRWIEDRDGVELKFGDLRVRRQEEGGRCRSLYSTPLEGAC